MLLAALLERVLLRLASCEGEEQLQQQINALLCPILLKFESTDASVRAKLMEILSHINKARQLCQERSQESTIGTDCMLYRC